MDNIQTILIPVLVLGGLGLIFAILLSYASKVFHVAVDRKVAEVRTALPGANCGACGFPGCDGLAEAIAKGNAPINACPIGGAPLAEKLSVIMGAELVTSDKEVAVVKCQGDKNKAKDKYEYVGQFDCRAINNIQNGNKACSYGCLGGASCQKACQFGAIDMVNGIAVIDKEKCTACRACIDTCPKELIELVPYKMLAFVKCKSHDKGAAVRKSCSIGCIGCKICEKQYPEGFVVEDNLARAIYDPNNVDMEKLNLAISKCPTKCIFPGQAIEPAEATEVVSA